MSAQTVARRYAAALADVVITRGEAKEVQDELTAWGAMMGENPQLREVFQNPTVPYEQKSNLLQTIITRTRVRPTTANFLNVLLKNHRIAEIEEINKRFADELDRRAEVVSAHITTARPVPPASREALESRLKSLTGRNVRLQFDIDEDLIGGIVTRIGSTVYDGSVRTSLQQIKEKITGQ